MTESAKPNLPNSGNFDLSLVIACYCEEHHLLANVMTLNTYLNNTSLSYELIFVEDKSPDNTAAEVKKCCDALAKLHVPFQALYHAENRGRGRTVTDGIRMATGDFVGFLDIDLENRHDALLPMILRLKAAECDVLVGKRAEFDPFDRPLRYISSFLYRWLATWLLSLPVSDSEAGFKIFRRDAILPILDHVEDEGWFWDTEIVHQAAARGLGVKEHAVVFVRNPDKKSTVRLFHDSLVYLRCISAYYFRTRQKKN